MSQIQQYPKEVQKELKFIEKQIADNQYALRNDRTASEEHFEKAINYWQQKKVELLAPYEVAHDEALDVVEQVSAEELQADDLADRLFSAFRGEDAYMKKDPITGKHVRVENEEVDENIKELALQIKALPEKQFLEVMKSIHTAIER